jgi:hypothetical protein
VMFVRALLSSVYTLIGCGAYTIFFLAVSR